MSTMGGVRRRRLSDLVRALIEEAWQRARRRRLIYAGIVALLAVIGAVVTAALQRPPASSSTPTAVASPSAPVSAVAVSAHKSRHHYRLYPGDVVDIGGGPTLTGHAPSTGSAESATACSNVAVVRNGRVQSPTFS
jgi:hypothetical protein